LQAAGGEDPVACFIFKAGLFIAVLSGCFIA
jgi:hypothetical protein